MGSPVSGRLGKKFPKAVTGNFDARNREARPTLSGGTAKIASNLWKDR